MYIGAQARVWVTRMPEEAHNEDCVVPKFKKGSACMVWGAICGGFKSKLFNWDREKIGNITGKGYQDKILPVSGTMKYIPLTHC